MAPEGCYPSSRGSVLSSIGFHIILCIFSISLKPNSFLSYFYFRSSVCKPILSSVWLGHRNFSFLCCRSHRMSASCELQWHLRTGQPHLWLLFSFSSDTADCQDWKADSGRLQWMVLCIPSVTVTKVLVIFLFQTVFFFCFCFQFVSSCFWIMCWLEVILASCNCPLWFWGFVMSIFSYQRLPVLFAWDVHPGETRRSKGQWRERSKI